MQRPAAASGWGFCRAAQVAQGRTAVRALSSDRHRRGEQHDAVVADLAVAEPLVGAAGADVVAIGERDRPRHAFAAGDEQLSRDHCAAQAAAAVGDPHPRGRATSSGRRALNELIATTPAALDQHEQVARRVAVEGLGPFGVGGGAGGVVVGIAEGFDHVVGAPAGQQRAFVTRARRTDSAPLVTRSGTIESSRSRL